MLVYVCRFLIPSEDQLELLSWTHTCICAMFTETTVDKIALVDGKPSFSYSRVIVNHVRRQIQQDESELVHLLEFIVTSKDLDCNVLLTVERARDLLESIIILQQKVESFSALTNVYSEYRYDCQEDLSVALFNRPQMGSLRTGIVVAGSGNVSAMFSVSRLDSLREAVQSFLDNCNYQS